MPRTVITESDFLLLRSEAEAAVDEIIEDKPDRVLLPGEKGDDLSTRVVSAGELFLTAMSALSKARRKLRGDGMAIDMSSEPLEMRFTGTIAGISDDKSDVLLKLEI